MSTPGMTALCLTVGAANILGEIAAAPGLLSVPADLYRVGRFAEDHLTDLPQRPAKKDGQTDLEWIADLKAWDRTILPTVEIKPAAYESLRALVRSSIEKSMLPARPSTVALLRALGLGPED